MKPLLKDQKRRSTQGTGCRVRTIRKGIHPGKKEPGRFKAGTLKKQGKLKAMDAGGEGKPKIKDDSKGSPLWKRGLKEKSENLLKELRAQG